MRQFIWSFVVTMEFNGYIYIICSTEFKYFFFYIEISISVWGMYDIWKPLHFDYYAKCLTEKYFKH